MKHSTLQRTVCCICFVLLALATVGCVRRETTIKVNLDGSGDLILLFGLTKQAEALIPASATGNKSGDIFDAIKTRYGTDYTYDRRTDGDYDIIEAKRHFSNLSQLEALLKEVDGIESFHLSYQPSVLQNNYVLTARLAPFNQEPGSSSVDTSAIDTSGAIDAKFVIYLPGTITQSNGKTTSDGGVMWEIQPDTSVDANASSTATNWLTIGSAGVALLLIIIGEGLILLFSRRSGSSAKGVSPAFLNAPAKDVSGTVDELLPQAVKLMQSGQREQAKPITAYLIRQYPREFRTWGVAAQLCSKREESIFCLQQLLRLKPDDEWARKNLEKLVDQLKGGKEARQPNRLGWIAGGVAVPVLGVGLVALSLLYQASVAGSASFVAPTPTLMPTATLNPNLKVEPSRIVSQTSRTSPAPAGKFAVIGDLVIGVSDSVFRPIPPEGLAAANFLNSAPTQGNEFVGVGVAAACNLSSNESCYLLSSDFKIVRADGSVDTPVDIYGVKEVLSATEFYGGSTTAGLIVFEVGVGETKLVLVYEKDASHAAYFEIPTKRFSK